MQIPRKGLENSHGACETEILINLSQFIAAVEMGRNFNHRTKALLLHPTTTTTSLSSIKVVEVHLLP